MEFILSGFEKEEPSNKKLENRIYKSWNSKINKWRGYSDCHKTLYIINNKYICLP